MPQAYTPQGRAKTCPWISLRGKEWKALSEIRNSSIESVEIQKEMLESFNEFKTQLIESIQDLISVEKEKLHIQETIRN